MQCFDWERAQDADPVMKRMKSLLEKYGDVYLCQHWSLLEMINGVATRVISDRSQNLRT